MVVKLAGIILILSIVGLVGDTLALSMEMLVGVILALLLKKLYAGGRDGRCYSCSINRGADRCHSRTTIKNY